MYSVNWTLFASISFANYFWCPKLHTINIVFNSNNNCELVYPTSASGVIALLKTIKKYC